MVLKIFQKGFNYSQDGRGNRLVYHLQGCNLRCPWCANPEGMYAENPLKKIREATPRQILEEAQESKPLLFDGGGVTFTGGEPTLQFTPLQATLALLREHGVHTAVESNATSERLCELFEFCDQMMLDCKHWNSDAHKKLTGAGNEQILRNIALAFQSKKDITVRTVLIRGVNDTERDANEFAKLFSAYGAENAKFELLSYHEYGKTKWAQCRRPYRMQNAFISPETLKIYQSVFREYGLRLIKT